MKVLSLAELDAIRQRVEAATPGPWYGDRFDGTAKYRIGTIDPNGPDSDRVYDDDTLVLAVDHKNGEHGFIGPNGDNDEAFVIHSRTDALALLAEIIRLRSALVEVELAAGRGALAEAGAIAAAALGA